MFPNMTLRLFTVSALVCGRGSIPGGEHGAAARISDGALASALGPGADSAGAGELGVLTGPAEVCFFTVELMPFITALPTPADMLTVPPLPIALIAARTRMGAEIEVSQAQGSPMVNRGRVQARALVHRLALDRERKAALTPALNQALALARRAPEAVQATWRAALHPAAKPGRHQARGAAAAREAAMAAEVATAGAAAVVAEAAVAAVVVVAEEEHAAVAERVAEEEVAPAAMEVASKFLTK